jgi:hypothetical protein
MAPNWIIRFRQPSTTWLRKCVQGRWPSMSSARVAIGQRAAGFVLERMRDTRVDAAIERHEQRVELKTIRTSWRAFDC